ncbi:MAG: TIGR03809 family protein [Pseudolabrys sp.]|nr:TIGR03809 family protein [Pseudolabrys sp.]MDP2298629.1 TIGR03809 family protein [Pseudolabrys sp.]
MQALPSGPRLDRIALKWHDLAQRRLDYYTELYRSGRWRLYYTQERFAIRMLDVINAAKKWRDLAGLPQTEAPPQSSQRDDTMRPAA